MIININPTNNGSSTPHNQSLQRHPPPGKDAFQVADSNDDGLVSETELEAVVEAIEKTTGNTVEHDDVLSSFDVSADGGLNGEELLALLSSYGIAPPEMPAAQDDGFTIQPASEFFSQVLSAYAANTGEDSIGKLIELLQKDNSADRGTSSIDVQA